MTTTVVDGRILVDRMDAVLGMDALMGGLKTKCHFSVGAGMGMGGQ